jgi:hypothetical protein
LAETRILKFPTPQDRFWQLVKETDIDIKKIKNAIRFQDTDRASVHLENSDLKIEKLEELVWRIEAELMGKSNH